MATKSIKAEVTGTVWKILAQERDDLEAEQVIMLMESMKMEIPVVSPVKGKLKTLLVNEGEEVSEGQNLAFIET